MQRARKPHCNSNDSRSSNPSNPASSSDFFPPGSHSRTTSSHPSRTPGQHGEETLLHALWKWEQLSLFHRPRNAVCINGIRGEKKGRSNREVGAMRRDFFRPVLRTETHESNSKDLCVNVGPHREHAAAKKRKGWEKSKRGKKIGEGGEGTRNLRRPHNPHTLTIKNRNTIRQKATRTKEINQYR